MTNQAANEPAAAAQQPAWVNDVLDFWFKQCKPNEWFQDGHTIDATVIQRFGPLHDEIAASVPEQAWTDQKTALATIIVLDQFPRNMFRGTSHAFDTDPLALELTKNAIAKGLDKGLSFIEATFMYLPFQHSEKLEDQEESLRLSIAINTPEEFMRFPKEHIAAIKRFGRFPWRNEILGRTSTPEEIEFCKGHNGYGQAGSS